ncbi:hypothetical protein JCM15124A_16510 [Prevotella falsenii]
MSVGQVLPTEDKFRSFFQEYSKVIKNDILILIKCKHETNKSFIVAPITGDDISNESVQCR